jgi:hypothetical protein
MDTSASPALIPVEPASPRLTKNAYRSMVKY